MGLHDVSRRQEPLIVVSPGVPMVFRRRCEAQVVCVFGRPVGFGGAGAGAEPVICRAGVAITLVNGEDDYPDAGGEIVADARVPTPGGPENNWLPGARPCGGKSTPETVQWVSSVELPVGDGVEEFSSVDCGGVETLRRKQSDRNGALKLYAASRRRLRAQAAEDFLVLKRGG